MLTALLGASLYGMITNRPACFKLGRDVAADVVVIFSKTPAPADATTSDSATPPAPATPPVAQAPVPPPPAPTVAPAPATVPTPAAPTNAPAAQSPAPTNASAAVAPTNASPVASTPPAPPAWTPPAVTPAQDNWTWTTAKATYKNVKITKIEADCVTIIDDDGGALVSIADLPADIQKMLNYDPVAAKAAATERQQDDLASQQALTAQRAFDESLTDYPGALSSHGRIRRQHRKTDPLPG
jgi:hypothetical protein